MLPIAHTMQAGITFHSGENMDPVSPTADVNLQNTWWAALISLGRRRNQPAELTGLLSSCCAGGAVAPSPLVTFSVSVCRA